MITQKELTKDIPHHQSGAGTYGLSLQSGGAKGLWWPVQASIKTEIQTQTKIISTS